MVFASTRFYKAVLIRSSSWLYGIVREVVPNLKFHMCSPDTSNTIQFMQTLNTPLVFLETIHVLHLKKKRDHKYWSAVHKPEQNSPNICKMYIHLLNYNQIW